MRSMPPNPYQHVDLEASAKHLAEMFERLDQMRIAFSLKACDHLIAVVEACKAGRFDRLQLMYLFEYVKTFSWAMTNELKEVVAIGASTKVKDDSYFRAVATNLGIVRSGLANAPRM